MDNKVKKQVEEIILKKYLNKNSMSIDEVLFHLNLICYAMYNQVDSTDSKLIFNIRFQQQHQTYQVTFQESPVFDFLPDVIWTQL